MPVNAALLIGLQGVKQIRQSSKAARYVFIAPPSEQELEKRLRGRGTENEYNVQKRLNQAKKELEYSKTPGVHDLIIVNDDSYVSTRWQSTLLIIGVSIGISLFNIFAAKHLPLAEGVFVTGHFFCFFPIIIILLVLAPAGVLYHHH